MNARNHFEQNSDTYIVSALVLALLAVPVIVAKIIVSGLARIK